MTAVMISLLSLQKISHTQNAKFTCAKYSGSERFRNIACGFKMAKDISEAFTIQPDGAPMF